MTAVPEADFRLYLRDLLRDGDIPDEIREQAEELQMKMASPGEWEAARFQQPDGPSENSD